MCVCVWGGGGGGNLLHLMPHLISNRVKVKLTLKFNDVSKRAPIPFSAHHYIIINSHQGIQMMMETFHSEALIS